MASPTYRGCAERNIALEPAAAYAERPKDKRHRENDRREVVDKLEDILGVLRRHEAIAEHAPGTSDYLRNEAEREADKRFMERIASIRQEMMLRRVYVHKYGGLVVPIGECWVKMTPASILQALKEAKRIYNGTHFCHDVESDAAPAHAIGNFTTDRQAQLTLKYAEKNAEVASRSIMPAVKKHWQQHLEKVRKFIEKPHQYPARKPQVDEEVEDKTPF
ncbi:MAG TPA: hypothetical protein PLB89_05180 [Flavobacteriales bacterium]|nr:hypothetical protein [Flavobacteriales bacterium]